MTFRLLVSILLLGGLVSGQQRDVAPLVDHHQHLFGPTAIALSPAIDRVDADRLITLLDEAGIQRAVVLSIAYELGNPDRPPVENE